MTRLLEEGLLSYPVRLRRGVKYVVGGSRGHSKFRPLFSYLISTYDYSNTVYEDVMVRESAGDTNQDKIVSQ